MNLKIYAEAALAAAFMATSCSSEEPSINPADNADANYMALSINLPSISGNLSRGVTYDDGTTEEYRVDNATLLVFKKSGSGEMDFTFVEADRLGGLAPMNTDADEQITRTATAVVQLSRNISVTNSDEYYGYMVLNNPVSGAISYPSEGQKFGEWLNTAQAVSTEVPFLMTSAPRWSANEMPLSLVKLDKSKIASTQSTATEVGATFYVERAVAKVTVTDSSMASKSVNNPTYEGDKVTIIKWALDVTNKRSFPGRNLQGLNADYADIWSNTGTSAPCTSRFVGGNNTFTRVFWSKDPNYNQTILTDSEINAAFNLLFHSALNASDNKGKAVYCLENTFDVNHMLQGQTTRVVFKANYQPKGLEPGTTFYRIGYQSTLWDKTNLANFIANIAAEKLGVHASKVAVTLSNEILNQQGNHLLAKDMIKNDGAAISDADFDKIVTALGASEGINTYIGGECYYIARIQHFGEETPWNLGDPTYNGDNLKYLGRYGVVRNNWYEINVGSISQPGSAIIPTLKPDVPDDEPDLWISVTVNVLPWAKRVQEVDL